jgi:hypothetical protein
MACRLLPEAADVLDGLGLAYRALGRAEEAGEAFCRAICVAPEYSAGWVHRGLMLREDRQPHAALEAMNKAIFLERERAETYGCRAAALNDLGRFDEAAIDAAKALTINPAQVDALSNRGVSRQQTGNIDDALTCYLRAIRINDNLIEAHNNAGALMLELCRPEAAIHHFECVLSRASEHVDANVSKAMANLLLGDFVLGFRLYEWRLRKLALPAELTNRFRWTGKDTLQSRTLLMHAEQGLGDTLQFCRYGRLAAEAGARVVLVLPRGLTRLFSAQRWVSQVIEIDEPLPAHELHCPMMSLPLAFGTTLETIPYSVGVTGWMSGWELGMA